MSASEIVKTDVYPLITTDPVINLPEHLDVNYINYSVNILPFEIFLDKDASKIYYTKLDIHSKKFVQHFKYIVSDIFKKPYAATPIAWLKLFENLSSLKETKKNVNSKTCIKFSMHMFAVKSCFTSGLRSVETGCDHLLQIGKHPMYLYYIEEERARTTAFDRQNRAFSVNDEWKFARVKLNQYTKYAVPAGTFYVLNSACKNYFSIHILRHGAQVTFEVTSINHLPAHKPYERFQRRISQNVDDYESVPTPRIEPASPPSKKRRHKPSTSSTQYGPCTPRIEDVDRDESQPSTSSTPDSDAMDVLDDQESTEAPNACGQQPYVADEILQHYANPLENPSPHTVAPVFVASSDDSHDTYFQARDPASAVPASESAQNFITVPLDAANYFIQYYTHQPPLINTVEDMVTYLKSVETEIRNPSTLERFVTEESSSTMLEIPISEDSSRETIPNAESLESSFLPTMPEIPTSEDPSQEKMPIPESLESSFLPTMSEIPTSEDASRESIPIPESLESSFLPTPKPVILSFEDPNREISFREDLMDEEPLAQPRHPVPDMFDEPLMTPIFHSSGKCYPIPMTPLPATKPVNDCPESASKNIGSSEMSYLMPMTPLPAAIPVNDTPENADVGVGSSEMSYLMPMTPLPAAIPVDDTPENADVGIDSSEMSYPMPMTPLPAGKPGDDTLESAAAGVDSKTLKNFISWYNVLNSKQYGPPDQYAITQTTENESALDLSMPKPLIVNASS